MTCNTCNECNPCEKENKPCCELKVLAGDCVDVEEVNWAYVVSATCPPRVVAWEWVEVESYDSPKEWFSIDYEVSAIDKKVGVCEADWNPSTLDEKLRVETWWPITRKVVWCGESSNGYMELGFDQSKLNIPDEKVAVKAWCEWDYLENVLKVESNVIQAKTVWCKMIISDKWNTFYDNNVCLWFTWVQDFHVAIDWQWDSVEPKFATWDIFTGNPDLATQRWILIKEDWYYRIFWQLTVQNNIWDNRYINLWRWLLRIDSPTRPILSKAYLSTAKHWEYALQVVLRWWNGINVDNNWVISVKEDWWEVDFTEWTSQDPAYNEWPWMTFNMDAYVDLRAWDLITVGYRPQTDMPEGDNWVADFRFVWLWDTSSEYQSLFWWACIGVQMVAPKTFNWDTVVERIRNA